MSRSEEMAVVQYFTDMSGIERLAGALFQEQEKQASDRTLKAIFRTFVRDEARHALVAQKLADFYNVHHFKSYKQNPALTRFAPHFVSAVRHFSPEVGNAYITSGELILDIALLRSINDFVGDAMSQQAMDRINQDESRHIAVDFHMIGYYSSKKFGEVLDQRPRPRTMDQLRALHSFVTMLYYAAPFFKGVFFEPMQLVDPSGTRLLEAFKRIQLVSARPTDRMHPFVAVLLTAQQVYNHSPLFQKVFGKVLARTIGVEPQLLTNLYTASEHRRAARMTFDEMANDALRAKTTL